MGRRWVATFFRWVLCAGLLLAAALAGCNRRHFDVAYGVIAPEYGVPVPPQTPSVVLMDFTYTPAVPRHGEGQLVFTAVTDKPAAAGEVWLSIDDPAIASDPVAILRDDGQAPDTTAGDGVWTAALPWNDVPVKLDAAPVSVKFHLPGGIDGPALQGPPLTVLPEEEQP